MMYAVEYTVRGRGRFPTDMLRYDTSFPAGGEDVALIEESLEDAQTLEDLRKERVIKLVARTNAAKWQPTIERWHSFLWGVDLDFRRIRY